MKKKSLVLKAVMVVMAAVLVLSSCVKNNDQEPPVEPAESNTQPGQITQPTNNTPLTYNYAVLSDSLQGATYSTFISISGEYFVPNNHGNTYFNYGTNANMLDVLTDGYQRSQGSNYLLKMKALLNGIETNCGDSLFSSSYYDAVGFLANASLRVYNLTKDAKYMRAVKKLYTQIKGGYNTTAGGGIIAVKGQPNYKTMGSTGNACIFAARLYKLQNNADDLTFAKSLYDWMKAKLVTPTGVVMDGINRNNDGYVDNHIFTYNQGLFIGSAVEMYNITKDHIYLQEAILTATNSLTDFNLIYNGILKSEGQGDGGLYKGVFVRYLTLLTEVGELDNANSKLFADFLQKNARLLYYSGIARPSLMTNPDWYLKPDANTDLTTQLSGVMMMEVAARLKAEGRIE